jgi:hypothetical protein
VVSRVVPDRLSAVPLSGWSKFCNAVLVLVPDVLKSDQFTEKSDSEQLKPNDEAGERVGQ